MASVTEFGGSPTCRQIREYPNGRQQTVEYTIAGEGNPENVQGMLSLPKRGDVHPRNADLRVVERTIQKLGPDSCVATIIYSREGYERGDLEEIEIEWHISGEEVLVKTDINGDYIETEEGAGVEDYQPRAIMIVTIYKSFFSPGTMYNLVGKVNNKRFASQDKGCFLYLGSEPARKVGSEKWQVRHVFKFNPDGHQKMKERIIYAQVQTGVDPDTGDPVYETQKIVARKPDNTPYLDLVEIKKEGDFSLLGLGL